MKCYCVIPEKRDIANPALYYYVGAKHKISEEDNNMEPSYEITSQDTKGKDIEGKHVKKSDSNEESQEYLLQKKLL